MFFVFLIKNEVLGSCFRGLLSSYEVVYKC